MSSRTLNSVTLIGNLASDPHFSTTGSGHPICTFTLATDRSWRASNSDEEKKETQWHWVVAWDKLAEICQKLLQKGTRIFIEGRLQYRPVQDNNSSRRGEVVLRQLIVLDKQKFREKNHQKI